MSFAEVVFGPKFTHDLIYSAMATVFDVIEALLESCVDFGLLVRAGVLDSSKVNAVAPEDPDHDVRVRQILFKTLVHPHMLRHATGYKLA